MTYANKDSREKIPFYTNSARFFLVIFLKVEKHHTIATQVYPSLEQHNSEWLDDINIIHSFHRQLDKENVVYVHSEVLHSQKEE